MADRDKFEKIVSNMVDKANRKRDTKQQHTDPGITLKTRQHSGDHFQSNNADSQNSKKELKVHKTVYQFHLVQKTISMREIQKQYLSIYYADIVI